MERGAPNLSILRHERSMLLHRKIILEKEKILEVDSQISILDILMWSDRKNVHRYDRKNREEKKLVCGVRRAVSDALKSAAPRSSFNSDSI